jgi:hypothetical protein
MSHGVCEYLSLQAEVLSHFADSSDEQRVRTDYSQGFRKFNEGRSMVTDDGYKLAARDRAFRFEALTNDYGAGQVSALVPLTKDGCPIKKPQVPPLRYAPVGMTIL